MAAPTSITAPILDATLMHEKRSSTADRMAAAATANQSSSSTTTSPTIRIVHPHEYKSAASCLAEAFLSDTVVRYSIDTPDTTHLTPAERDQIHRESMEYVTYAHCLKGLVLAIGNSDESFDCVALWLPPGKNIDDWWTIFRSGMWRLNWKLSQEGKERFFKEFLPLLGKSKAEVMGERDGDSWYLNYIGTRATARGRGYARKLVEYVTRQADIDGKACYLESSHDINLKIYGKMGFELKKQIYLQREKSPIKMDVMVREPVMVGGKETEIEKKE